MIKIFSSNSLLQLAKTFQQMLQKRPLETPFEQEKILVQSIGMGRWLSLQMAEKLDIWANFDYIYPNAFINNLASNIKNSTSKPLAEKTTTCWDIFSLLMNKNEISKYPIEVQSFCNDEIKAYQLSEKLSDLYDQYSFSRIEMISKWIKNDFKVLETGKWQDISIEDSWQKEIWQKAIFSNYTDRVELHSKIISEIKNNKLDLPPRISLFGISTLPVYHLEILKTLSEQCDIYFYLLNPCQEFWYLDKSEKELSKIEQNLSQNATLESEYYETGNSILSSLGKLGLEFHTILINQLSDDFSDDFVRVDDTNLLSKLQNDILTRTNRADQDNAKSKIYKDDNSIQLHSSYSIQREMETLKDNLLKILDANEDINPRDILVMATDIETYAPYIENVFSEKNENYIPYSIADLNLRKRFDISEILIKILNIHNDRFSISAIFDILQYNSVKSKFNISDDDLEMLKQKISQSGIRWGIDNDFRKDISGIGFDENSINFGINRMLSGLISQPNDKNLIFDFSPFLEIEGINYEILGRFIDYLKILSKIYENIKSEKSIENWIDFVNSIFEFLIYEKSENSPQIDEIRKKLIEIKSSYSKSKCEQNISFNLFYYILESQLNQERTSFGFLDGRMTFCAMLPMRSIPFKVIAMLGMNEKAFPRSSKPLSFDLLRRSYKFGDRIQKNDDRYLFLESIISAQNYLYISYIGKNISDDSIMPPSVLVNELVNYLDNNYFINGNCDLKNDIIHNHKLHSFDTIYFDKNNERFFSYDKENFHILKEKSLNKSNASFIQLSSEIPEELLNISINDFIKFFINPTKYFLQNRLGINYEDTFNILDDEEPFAIGPFENHNLINNLVPKTQNEIDKEKTSILKKGIFPPAEYGKYIFDDFNNDLKLLQIKVKDYLEKYSENIFAESIKLKVVFNKKEYKLNISFPNNSISKHGVLYFKKSSYPRDIIRVFINHMLCSTKSEDTYSMIRTIKNNDYDFKNIDSQNALEYIKTLAKIYIEGLFSPIPFFANASYEYVQKDDKNKAFNSAVNNYLNPRTGDYLDNYISFLHRDDLYSIRDSFIHYSNNILGLSTKIIERIK